MGAEWRINSHDGKDKNYMPGMVACISNHSIGKGEAVRPENDKFEARMMN